MGAQQFRTVRRGKTAAGAFSAAVEQACYDHGHSGYSGTIAEKTSFVEIPVPEGEDPMQFADKLLEDCDKRVDDKWGPAGCISLGPEKWLFFGWASS